MNSFSPIGAGFRLVFRSPAIALAEIAWRWTFAATAWMLSGALLFEYLDTLPVGRAESFLLSTGQPFLVWRALRNVFQGSLLRFTEATILTVLGLMIAWILLASVGRLVVVRAILSEPGMPEPSPRSGVLSTLFSLNFLRAALVLATKLSALGAALAASSLWASTHIAAADAARLFVLAWLAIGAIWLALNWLLATSAVLTVADQGSQRWSFLSAVRLLQQHPGPVLVTAISFGILQILGIAAVCGAALSLLAIVGSHPAVLLFLEFTLLLIYSVISDFLHVAAMVAYIRILKGEDPALTPQTAPGVGPFISGQAIDRDEVILSDVPLPAV
jgi:hypothetical protein